MRPEFVVEISSAADLVVYRGVSGPLLHESRQGKDAAYARLFVCFCSFVCFFFAVRVSSLFKYEFPTKKCPADASYSDTTCLSCGYRVAEMGYRGNKETDSTRADGSVF